MNFEPKKGIIPLQIPTVNAQFPRGLVKQILQFELYHDLACIRCPDGVYSLPPQLNGWAGLSHAMELDGQVMFGRFAGPGRPHGGFFAEWLS